MKCFSIIIIFGLFFGKAVSQGVQPYKQVRAGYGVSIAGRGDIPGHQLMLGVQNQLSRHGLLDVRLSGTLMERTRTWDQKYKVIEKSNGISLEADYAYAFYWGHFLFYPSIGPAIRYSHEVYPEYISIHYDLSGSNRIINFEAPSEDRRVLRSGVTSGLNLDRQVSDRLTIGFRTSFQIFKGNTIYFVGLMVKNTKWHF